LKAFKPGYAITVHGMQGNQCEEVIFFPEGQCTRELLNTVVGRPTNRLTLVLAQASAPVQNARYGGKYNVDAGLQATLNSLAQFTDPLTGEIKEPPIGTKQICDMLKKIQKNKSPEKQTVANWWLYNFSLTM